MDFVVRKSFFDKALWCFLAGRFYATIPVVDHASLQFRAAKKPTKKRPDFFGVSLRFRLTFIGQSGTLMVSVR
jgi:hypothetical protein